MSENTVSSSLPAFSDYEPETIRVSAVSLVRPKAEKGAASSQCKSNEGLLSAAADSHNKTGNESVLKASSNRHVHLTGCILILCLVLIPVSTEMIDSGDDSFAGSVAEPGLQKPTLEGPTQFTNVKNIKESALVAEHKDQFEQLPLPMRTEEAERLQALVSEQIEQAAILQQELQASMNAERAAMIEEQKQLAEQIQAEAREILAAERAELAAEKQRLEAEARQFAERKALLAEQEQSARKRQVQMEVALAERDANLVAEQQKIAALQRLEAEKKVADDKAAVMEAENRTAERQQNENEIREKLDRKQQEFLAALQKYAEQQRSKPDEQTASGEAQITAAVVTRSLQPGKADAIAELFSRVESGNITYLQRYLKNGGNPDQLNSQGESLLAKAAARDQFIVVSELLRAGADVNLANGRGESALHLASAKGHTGIVSLLVSKEAKVNHLRWDGATALMMASARDFREIAGVLIEAGADVNLRNQNGRSALDYAEENSHNVLATFLLDIGADKSLIASKGQKNH